MHASEGNAPANKALDFVSNGCLPAGRMEGDVKIGIAGAKGFIGSHLLRHLLEKTTFEVVALTRTVSGNEMDHTRVRWMKGDLNLPADCDSFVADVGCVIHLAHTGTPLSSNRNYPGDVLCNLIPSLHLFEAIKRSGKKQHVIYPSSGGAVYASRSAGEPFTEEDPCSPETSYGVLKLTTEKYLEMGSHQNFLRATVFRIGNPYGAVLSPERMQGFIGVAMGQVLQGSSVRVFGNPSNVRDYIHLDDLCSLIVQAVKEPDDFSIYNAGSGSGHSVEELIGRIGAACGRKVDVLSVESKEAEVLPAWVVLDGRKAEARFSWKCEISLEEGLERMKMAAEEHKHSRRI